MKKMASGVSAFALALAQAQSFSAWAGQPSPLSMQIDRTVDPSPICANRLSSASGCQALGNMPSSGPFQPHAYAGTVAPGAPLLGDEWNDTSASIMLPVVRIWDGAQWVAQGTLNATTHVFAIGAAQLPPPTTTARGGSLDASAPANQFQIGMSSGVPIFAQVLFSNIAGLVGLSQLSAVAQPSVPIIPGLSQSTATFTGTTVAPGNGGVVLSAGHDFVVGQGVLIPKIGAAFPSYGAGTISGITLSGNTGSDTTTRCYRLLPLDGAQGFGTLGPETCIANAPALPSKTDYVRLPFANGSNPPPAYAIVEGATGGPYTLIDFIGNSGPGYDYGRPASKQEFWLPTSFPATLAAQNDAVHGVVASVAGTTIDVGVGLTVTAGTAITAYHDNALPIYNALKNSTNGVLLPVGTYPTSVTSFGGTTLTSNGQSLLGSDYKGSVIQLMTGMVGAPFLSESGIAPSFKHLTIDANGFNADQSGLMSINGATGAVHDDFSLLNVAKNAITNGGSFGTVFSRFNATGSPDFANQSTFLHSVHNYNTKVSDFTVSGFGFDMADAGCEIRTGTLSNFISAGVGTEQDPFAFGCRIHDNVLAPSLTPIPDVNGTSTECVESWAPDDAIENNDCRGPIGSAYSIGGQRSRVLGNTASTTVANPTSAYIIRLDSSGYFPAGAIISGNTDSGPFAYGLAELGTASRCTGCVIGPNSFAGTTSAINAGSFTHPNDEKFVATSSTPQ